MSLWAECKRTQPEHTASQRLKNIDGGSWRTPSLLTSLPKLFFIHCDRRRTFSEGVMNAAVHTVVLCNHCQITIKCRDEQTLKSNLHLCFLFLNIAHSNIKYFKKIFRICDVLNSPFWAIMKAAVLQGLELIMETGSSAISWKRGCREPAPNPHSVLRSR